MGNGAAEERQLLLDAVRMCAKRREGTSLFLSAIRSGKPAMIKAVVEGCNKLVPNAKVRHVECLLQRGKKRWNCRG